MPEATCPAPGKSAYELLESAGEPDGIRALFVIGSNPVVSAPNAIAASPTGSSALDFLVVADFFLSETAKLADVVLPSAQWAEEDGTMTNLEGRVIRRRRALEPPGQARTDIEILCALARALGKSAHFSLRRSARGVRRAARGDARRHSPTTPASPTTRIEREDGVFWPCPADDHPGTPRLFADDVSDAERTRALPRRSNTHGPADVPDEQFPLYLTTGRVLAHYQSGTQTRRVAQLHGRGAGAARRDPPARRETPRPRRRRSPSCSRRDAGSATFIAESHADIREDTVFVPFHWRGEPSANRLTNAALDPISRMPEFKVCAVRANRSTR